MGAHSWVRDEKRAGKGKTFVAGAAAVIPSQPPPKKRKLIWQRDPDASDKTTTPSTTTDPASKTTDTQQPNITNAAAKTAAAKIAELELLQKKIAERERALQETKRKAAAAAAAAQENAKKEEIERENRKKRLEIGFSSAFAAAKQAADADIAASKTPISFADRSEVERVLKASSDYAVLRLEPGADSVLIRKRYREMAVQLHPDKCKVERAGDAFQRMVKAYQQLSKYAR